MLYTPEQLWETIYKPVNDVYQVFKDHFGEEYTDLKVPSVGGLFNHALLYGTQEDTSVDLDDVELIRLRASLVTPYILVWWPKVTVTNENGKSIVITDLYAKVEINLAGNIPFDNVTGFLLTRTSMSEAQYDSNYLHSHVSWYSACSIVPGFLEPCLGRGPIKHTVVSLMTDSSPELWMLFCVELSNYVTVESLEGIPYRDLIDVGKKNSTAREFVPFPTMYENSQTSVSTITDRDETLQILKEFIVYYIHHGNLQIDYSGGKFSPGNSFNKYLKEASSLFIKWCNSLPTGTLKTNARKLLKRYHYANGKFYTSVRSSTITADGLPCFDFKGNTIYFHVIRDEEAEEDENFVYLLQSEFATSIYNNIFNILNYHHDTDSHKTINSPRYTSTPKKVWYLQNACSL